MRWVFYSLIAINLGFLVWQVLIAPSTPSSDQLGRPESVAESQMLAEPLRLLSEAPDQAVALDNEGLADTLASTLRNQLAEVKPNVPADAGKREQVNQRLCDAFGPFLYEAQAQQYRDAIQVFGVEAAIQPETKQVESGFWAYVASLGSLQEALAKLAQLKGQGIDAYLISEGELSNGLSLGVFERKADAQALLARGDELGVEIMVRANRTDHEQFWVVLQPIRKESERRNKLKQIREFSPTAQQAQKLCKSVASPV